ncbi:MAG: acetyltransferase [Proteobacteria bacterium]|nr:acetyltransferase [Pseudomonadota bacterium]
MPKKLVILGTNGNCVDMLDAIDAINAYEGHVVYECVGFVDDNPSLHGTKLCGIEILGPLAIAGDLKGCHFVNGIGSPSNFTLKNAIISKTGVPLERFETIIHPSVKISKTAQIGQGTVVFENVAVTSNVKIGNHVIILPNSVISHDVEIGDYTCITGGVCISGGTAVGTSCYLGTNCSIIGGIKIGDYSLVGMGSVVLGTVAENSVVVGNPARFIRHARK